jgi:hypothetical protein
MAYYPQYYADHNGKHEIFKDMPTPCNDLKNFTEMKDLVNARPIRFPGIKEILSVPVESFSDAKVVNANEESQLDRIEKKLDALSQKLDNIFGSQVLINGKFTQL